MSSPTPCLEIFCDEAGSTGPDLLDPQQRYFAYSSVALTESEAVELIREARSRFPVQMPELKSKASRPTPSGGIFRRTTRMWSASAPPSNRIR
jgi:hypothetical protein